MLREPLLDDGSHRPGCIPAGGHGWLGLATGGLRGLQPTVGVCGELGMEAGGLARYFIHREIPILPKYNARI